MQTSNKIAAQFVSSIAMSIRSETLFYRFPGHGRIDLRKYYFKHGTAL